MPIARGKLVSVDATPYYHLVSRCCRRCFILGEDPVTKIDYSHRQEWIEARLEELPEIFNIKRGNEVFEYNRKCIEYEESYCSWPNFSWGFGFTNGF